MQYIMKRNLYYKALGLSLVVVALFLTHTMQAQQITEALQKQIWTAAAQWPSADWENLAPGDDSDTIFSINAAQAEVVNVNAAGRPVNSKCLVFFEGRWEPVTETQAAYDAQGHLIGLNSYKWLGGAWENESRTEKTLDEAGNALTFRMMYWVDGGWEIAYQNSQSKQTGSISGNFQP